MIHSNEGNFTKLELIPIVNKLRTKYSMKLYEFLKSFEEYRSITIQQSLITKLLGLENIKTYQRFFELTRLLQRQVNEIIQKTDLKDLQLILDKKQKRFTFIINQEKQKDAEETKIEEIVNRLNKRFT